jgi:predicted amidohydrolase YtcJ
MATANAAVAARMERDIGTIAPGRAADLLILSGDPLTSAPERLHELRVETAVLGGEAHDM